MLIPRIFKKGMKQYFGNLKNLGSNPLFIHRQVRDPQLMTLAEQIYAAGNEGTRLTSSSLIPEASMYALELISVAFTFPTS